MIERYGIYWANLDPVIGTEMKKRRPVVVISMDKMNALLETVVICPLTTVLHPKWRTRIQIMSAKRKAEIAVDQIRAISKKRISQNLDHLTPNTSKELRKLIQEMYALP